MEQDGNPADGQQPHVGGQPTGPPPGFQQPGYPQPSYQQPGQPQPGFPGAPGGYPGYQPVQYPEESQAVLALSMSLIGLVVCSGLLCPVGWYFANKDLAGIAAGRRDPSKKDLATAGKIIGIIGTVLVILGVIAFIGFIVLIAATEA